MAVNQVDWFSFPLSKISSSLKSGFQPYAAKTPSSRRLRARSVLEEEAILEFALSFSRMISGGFLNSVQTSNRRTVIVRYNAITTIIQLCGMRGGTLTLCNTEVAKVIA